MYPEFEHKAEKECLVSDARRIGQNFEGERQPRFEYLQAVYAGILQVLRRHVRFRKQYILVKEEGPHSDYGSQPTEVAQE